MPWDFHFDKELNTLFFQGSGEFTDDDMVAGQDYCQSHPDYHCEMDQLNDFAGISRFRVTPIGFLRVIHGRKGRGGGRMAVVVSSNHGFGLGRMFEMMQEKVPVKIHIFRDRAAALEWLGLTEAQCPWSVSEDNAV